MATSCYTLVIWMMRGCWQQLKASATKMGRLDWYHQILTAHPFQICPHLMLSNNLLLWKYKLMYVLI